MTRVLSIRSASHVDEIPQKLLPALLTFLGMKLYSENIVPLHGCGKLRTVLACTDYVPHVRRLHYIGMHEVEVASIDIRKQRMISECHVIPPDVWQAGHGFINTQSTRCPRNPAQPCGTCSLFSPVREKLHAQTNPQKWFLCFLYFMSKCLDYSTFAQTVHAIFKSTHPVENNMRCVCKIFWIFGQDT